MGRVAGWSGVTSLCPSHTRRVDGSTTSMLYPHSLCARVHHFDVHACDAVTYFGFTAHDGETCPGRIWRLHTLAPELLRGTGVGSTVSWPSRFWRDFEKGQHSVPREPSSTGWFLLAVPLSAPRPLTPMMAHGGRDADHADCAGRRGGNTGAHCVRPSCARESGGAR